MSLNNPFNGKIAGFDEDRITNDKVKEDCLRLLVSAVFCLRQIKPVCYFSGRQARSKNRARIEKLRRAW